MSFSFIILQDNFKVWKMPIKIRMGKAHSSFCMSKCPCRHVCMYAIVHVCICLYTYICMWHVYSLKPKTLEGDHNMPTKTEKPHCVSCGTFISLSMLQRVAVWHNSCSQNLSNMVNCHTLTAGEAQGQYWEISFRFRRTGKGSFK